MTYELDRATVLDPVLPSQLAHDAPALDISERRLRLAVLEDAIHALQRHARDRGSRRLYAEAFEWVADEDRAEPYSFVNVCEALGLEASYLRRGLLGTRRTLTPIRRKRFSLRRAA